MSAPEEAPAAVAQVEVAVKDEVKAEGGDVGGMGLPEEAPFHKGLPLWDVNFKSTMTLPETPPEVERRIKALKKLQIEHSTLESSFFKEMHELEAKYAPLYVKFYERRLKIATGEYEPTDDECEAIWGTASESEVNKEESKAEGAGGEKKIESPAKPAAPVSGIPDFWLHVFRNVDRMSEMIHDCDEVILKHLMDITMELTTEPMGFKLLFHFSPNEYFTDSVLTKTYIMKCEVDPQDPFGFEGPEIINCKGCTIDWKEGKNVTVRLVKKKQKHKQTGVIRTTTKEEPVPSFFEFFNPPQLPEDGIENEDDVQMTLTMDFEVGQYIRERIIPRAVLYYTGEALDYETSDGEEDDEDDEDDDGDTSRTSVENDEEEANNET